MELQRVAGDLNDGSRFTLTIDGQLSDNDQRMDHLKQVIKFLNLVVSCDGQGSQTFPESEASKPLPDWIDGI